MKLYKEAMRRLGLVGLAFLIVSVVLTAIFCASSANAILQGVNRVNSVFDLLPTLSVFAFAGGLVFAFVGFSFLNKRSDSDFYHSLPIRRVDLYIANTLAALTWTVATVVLSAIASLIVYLFVAVPFVPLYYPLGVLFFIVATMLTYAAAAIAMSITGTFFTNVVMTGIVLFLPRFLLFMIGRTIVANVSIVGWWDLQGLLDPRTNVATGLVVMTRRAFLGTDFVTLSNSLYSLLLAAAEIVIGGWLFVKRPSELAERGAKNGKLQTLFACLLTLPVLLVMLRYTQAVRKLTIAVLIVASLVIYVAYQLIAMRNVKRVAKSLPWYLCTVALSLAVFFGMRAVTVTIRDVTPAANEIRQVQFGVPEPEYGDPGYNDLLVSEIVFTEEAVKECVSEYLGSAVERLRLQDVGEYYNLNRTFESGVSNSIIPVKITLNNGRVIRRTFEFTNMNRLNEARNSNSAYMTAIREFPQAQEACFANASTYSGKTLDKAETLKIKECCFAEKTAQGEVASDYFEIKPIINERARYYLAGDEQQYGSIGVSGYHGTRRYYQYYSIELDTPETASLWMQLNNQLGGADAVRRAERDIASVRENPGDDAQFYINFGMTNVPMQDGTKQQVGLSYNEYYYNGESQGRQDPGAEYFADLLELLKRGTQTSDPTSFNVCMYYNVYRPYAPRAEQDVSVNQTYYAFAPEDEKELLRIMIAWNEALAERERVYDPNYVLPEIAPQAE